MNLISDLETEIAFAILNETKRSDKFATDEVLSLIGRLNQVFEQISENDKTNLELVYGADLPPQTAHS